MYLQYNKNGNKTDVAQYKTRGRVLSESRKQWKTKNGMQ